MTSNDAVRATPSVQMDRLDEAKTIGAVVRNLDQAFDWSIRTQSTIGYFAAAYKRATVAIRQALDAGHFHDGQRIERFDLVFAPRYFDALNAYFYPGEYKGLTLACEVTFVGHLDKPSTILQ